MRDFEVYWTAAGRAAAGEPLYRVDDGHYQFKYLPAFAVLTAPIATLPLPAAKAAWFCTSIALLVTLIAFSLAILPERRRSLWLLTAVLVVAMGKFYGHELVLGQVNILFAALIVTAIAMIRAGHDLVAALMFVAAVAVKPYAVIFLPWLGFARGPRALFAAAGGIAALLVLPVVVYGLGGTIDLHRNWWFTVTESTAPNLTNADNVSIAGMASKWLGQGRTASVVTLVITAVVLGAAGFVAARRPGIADPEPLEGALLLTLIPLISPQGWDYVFLVSTPAVAIFANYDDRLPPLARLCTWLAIATIGLSLFDVLGRERYAAFMSWSLITGCFLVVVAALVGLRVRRAA
jgi:hypothetical protein